MSCECKDCQKKRAIRDMLMVMFVDTESDAEIQKINAFVQFISEKLAEKVIEAKKIDHADSDASESPKQGETVH